MKALDIPAFGEADFTKHRENATATVVTVPNADEAAFAAYGTYFLENGFLQKERYTQGTHHFAAYQKDTCGIFLNYYGATRELRIVAEENCLYFAYADAALPKSVAPQITQVTLEDFGLSYVIRLSDGRFIVIDGGCNFEPDQDRLLNCLMEGANGEKPVIAAWLMSHPHGDHFHCFIGFMERYADRVTVEKFMLNFPEADDLAHYPKLANKDPRFVDSSGVTNIPRMLALMQKTCAPIYMVHTGQRYQIGDAACEVLASIDDTIHLSDNINATSVVLRMELGGQVILWATDASFSIAKLPERYGSYLKADILQVPHHGFQSGTAEGEIAGYDLIKPQVCFLPVSDYNAYTAFCIHKKGTGHLMYNCDVAEMITGSEQRTITLPYEATPHGRAELRRKCEKGLDDGGARTWVFSELSTANADDFVFSLLNTTHAAATVWIELYFEDASRKIRHIKTTIKPGSLKKLCIIGDEVDSESLYFNWLSLKKQGIPENADFAVRFISDIPIVASHKIHQATYHSTVNI